MIRISIPWIKETVSTLEELRHLTPETSNFNILITAIAAKEGLENLYFSLYAPYLRATGQHAGNLRISLEKLIEASREPDRKISFGELAAVNSHANQMISVMISELGVVPTYILTPKGSYDVNLLAENGERLFPEKLLQKVPDARPDTIEAGKALAFELPTACGFHAFRVLETVLKKYWDVVSDGSGRPSLETIGTFARELQKNSYGDCKVWETLQQIGKLHRNPLIHPEVMLTVEEAIGILGISCSVISMMLSTIPDTRS